MSSGQHGRHKPAMRQAYTARLMQVARPVLYTFRRCPYAIRARLALAYAGIDVEQREVELCDKPATLLAISAKATVPVLQLANGAVIDQSLDIMHWALQQHDPDGWLRLDEASLVRQWIDSNDGTFKQALDRYKYAVRYPAFPAAEHRTYALELFVFPLERQLQTAQFVLGDTASIADAAIFPFVRQFAMVDRNWFDGAALPHVRGWLEGWLSSRLFASVMGRNPVWR